MGGVYLKGYTLVHDWRTTDTASQLPWHATTEGGRVAMGPDSEQRRISLEDAYAVDGPDDNRRLYAAWASTYETGFVQELGYVYHLRVAEIFTAEAVVPTEAVLDVGCGTGVVGVELRRLGVTTIDGLDISPEMLVEAGKKSDAGTPVYRNLIEADLTGVVPLASEAYAGIVSAGTFTHGHLGPDSFDELYRMAAPGARCTIGINSSHYEELGFAERLRHDHQAGIIGDYELIDIAGYEGRPTESADDIARIAVFDIV
jgi:SAM-dependent methyltransferase